MKKDILTPKFPTLLHGGDYNPDQWLDCPEILEQDIVLMKEAHINCVSLGIFAWAKLEPQEGVFDFDWLETIINNLYENGIYTVLATPSGARPHWMAQKYPEVLRVPENGVRNLMGERHNHCYTSPIYREKVKTINEKLSERFANHPAVILWHLSNEYNGDCHCELCQEAFRDWLKEKYQTLDNLNHEWWNAFWSHTYTDWSQIHSPAFNGERSTNGLNLDWKRFATHQTVEFVKMERDAVKKYNPDIPVTINMMGQYDGLNYFKFKDVVDVVSWDSYPLWHKTKDDSITAADIAFSHDLMRGVNLRPFLLMESTPSATNWQPISKLKRPGMHLLSSMQAVAHGSDSVQYFQWRKGRGANEKLHGAVVDHYGKSDTRVFRDVTAVGKTLEAVQEVCGSRVESQVAILFDWENRWAVTDAAGPRNMGIHYEDTVKQHYNAFWQAGIPVDVVDMECDLSSYKIVIAPMLYLLRAGITQKIKDFTANGGTFVTTYWSGIVNENDLCWLGGWPGDGLMDVVGLRSEEIDALYDGETNGVVIGENDLGLQGEYGSSELMDQIICTTAKPLAVYESDFYAGNPCLTVNSYGKGSAYYIASKNDEEFLQDFYAALAEKCGIVSAFNLPYGVIVSTRQGENATYYFLQNYNNKAKTIRLPASSSMVNLVTGEAVGTSLEMAPFGVIVLKK